MMEAPGNLRARKAVMWTREDCQRLAGTGLLPERWELVEGEIISKMGTNLAHARTAQRMVAWLMSVFGSERILPTCSIDVAPEDNPTSEPEPDITVLSGRADDLLRNPRPEDIAMVIEVSDSTLEHDLGAKAQLYARAGIAEYWVVDVQGRRVFEYREPGKFGYGRVRCVEGDGEISPLAEGTAVVRVGELLG